MLTKSDREALAKTAESLSDCTLYYSEIYKCLYGEYPRNDMPNTEYDKAIITRIVDLCNTSNMVELPRDKDGEVIHVGDTVFDDYGSEWVVNGIDFKSNDVLIYTYLDGECARFLPYELTHKQPVTIKSLAQRIKHVLEDEATSIGVNPYVELGRIADQLESLGDSDD